MHEPSVGRRVLVQIVVLESRPLDLVLLKKEQKSLASTPIGPSTIRAAELILYHFAPLAGLVVNTYGTKDLS
jgi:hypothetical protein